MTLSEHIEVKRIDVAMFADLVGVHRSTIYRVMNGEGCTRKTAKRIEVATGGAVSAAEVIAAQKVPELDDDDLPAVDTGKISELMRVG